MLNVGDEVMFYRFTNGKIIIGRGIINYNGIDVFYINWGSNRTAITAKMNAFPFDNDAYIEICDNENYHKKLNTIHDKEVSRLRKIALKNKK